MYTASNANLSTTPALIFPTQTRDKVLNTYGVFVFVELLLNHSIYLQDRDFLKFTSSVGAPDFVSCLSKRKVFAFGFPLLTSMRFQTLDPDSHLCTI